MERSGGEGARHPMGVVVQRTGLTSHVLRAWERRYAAVEPARSEGGQRLYSDADVVRLRLLKRATEGGRAIGTVADLPTEALAALVGEDLAAPEVRVSRVSDAELDRHLTAALGAADRLDGAGLRGDLMRAVVQLGSVGFVMGVAAPLLERVGDLWEAGALRPAQEHVVSAAVRQVLDWLLSRYEAPSTAPLLVAGTLSGEQHEFGAMLAAVVAADAGWRVLYPGPSLPASELAEAARRTGARVVGVSVVHGGEEALDGASAELRSLRAALPAGVVAVVGGRHGGRAAPEGMMVVSDLAALREVLETVGPRRAAEGA